MNALEEIAAEWAQYQDLFVLTNVNFGKTPHGGYEGEMDVVMYDPKNKTVTHIELSFDADSWQQRKERMEKKFRNAERHYREVLHFDYEKVEKLAVVGLTKTTQEEVKFDGVGVITVPAFIERIVATLKTKDPLKEAVPEKFPLLRAMQFALWFGAQAL